MGLTGKFKFRKTLWGKIVLQLEEEVKPFWSRSQPVVLKRRWRDATLMDLAAPEMRHLIDMRFKPYLYAHTSASRAALHQRPRPRTGISTKRMVLRRTLRARMGRCAGSRTERQPW